MDNASIARKLQRLVGRQVNWQGDAWILIDVLAREDCLVLRRCSGAIPVQADQYGHASCRYEETVSVALSDDAGGYSSDALELIAALR